MQLRIGHGEVVAFVGENGSGKSTLINLLPRFFDPQHGAVHIDGIPVRQVALRDLRRQIGLVTQETILFDDTLYENIRYGKPNATRQEVEEAARKRTSRRSSATCRKASRPASAKRGGISREGNASASLWRGQSFAIRRS